MVKRFKNADWRLPVGDNGAIESWELVAIAVLMDIRDELQALNRLLACPNFIRIPSVLDGIAVNTKRRKQTKKAAK